MMLFEQKSDCCGCTACATVCPCGAITMTADDEGFSYPEINNELCVDCGQCRAVCQIHSLQAKKTIDPIVYAAKNASEDIRAKSTSGGMFSAFADEILADNGVIYGVAYDENFTARHERAESAEQCQRFRGSKYVQSELGDCFTHVKEDVESGRRVLFVGTPCQIGGLKTYLGDLAEANNLLLCEIICHGAPSPKLWKEHIALLESERRSKVVNYKNRSKVLGWHGHNEHIFFENGKEEYDSKLSNLHKDLFYAHLTIRPSCYTCRYTGFPRHADITIADFWGIENFMPDFDDNKGVSMLILNTPKAVAFYNTIKDSLICRESTAEQAFYDNHKRPAKMNVNRENFWHDYHQNGYLFVARKYAAYTVAGRIKRTAKIIIKAWSKRLGIYRFIHQFTLKKYQKETYK